MMKQHQTNPLLEISSLPNMAPPFDRIAADDFLPATRAAIEEARANIEAIKANPAKPNFENTILALETASETLGLVGGVFYNLLSAAGNDKLQELSEEIGPLSANFSSDVGLDPVLFARVKAVWDDRNNETLTTEQYKLLEESYSGFVRSGALLPEDKKQRLREISEALSTLGPKFSNNVKKSSEKFELWIEDEKDLSGIPDTARAIARQMAEDKGQPSKWLFTLDVPSYIPVVQFADDRAMRERIWRAFATRAWGDDFDNSALIMEIIRLKNERAKLLGYETHADYVMEKRMAEKPAEVMAFLNRMKETYRPAAEKDLQTLKNFAGQDIQPWDIAYFSEKLKENIYNFSSEELRPYFPMENVLKGVFEHFTKLFNVRFEENKKYPTWHADVQAFDVFDDTSNRFLGTFYADFYPREGKKDGAWMTSFRDQGLYAGEIRRPIIAIVCNFTKPTKDQPSLLSFDEVTTLFHEMGHAMHGMLSDVSYVSLAGTNVLWDFVELPSQLQENWAYQKETLDMFAAHYQTGEKIPPELIQKLNDSKNFMGGWGGLRQTNLGYLDMAWHTADPTTIGDVASFEDRVTADTTLFKRQAGPTSAAFSHLFAGGYSAGYYSYKWAEVLDADAFEAFETNGLYDRATAEAYKAHVLSKGGSEHPRVLYARFRGRDADPDALLRREGLKSKG
ncbi:MAG: peptidase family protein [Micavibrio sp.]|nr:peptidase family protein [Micavibrio sp.]